MKVVFNLKFEEIKYLLDKNNGLLTTKEAEDYGIYRGSIKYLSDKRKQHGYEKKDKQGF